MGLIKILSIIYFIFTIILLIHYKRFKKSYLIFGLISYLFIIGYALIPKAPTSMQSLLIFIVFSCMILNFGLMNGFLMLIFNKSNSYSISIAIISSTIMLMILFNFKGFLTYMYIPTSLYLIQSTLNKHIIANH